MRLRRTMRARGHLYYRPSPVVALEKALFPKQIFPDILLQSKLFSGFALFRTIPEETIKTTLAVTSDILT